MFALGIMGEYLARIFVRNIDRPIYTIRENCNSHMQTSRLTDNKQLTK